MLYVHLIKSHGIPELAQATVSSLIVVVPLHNTPSTPQPLPLAFRLSVPALYLYLGLGSIVSQWLLANCKQTSTDALTSVLLCADGS